MFPYSELLKWDIEPYFFSSVTLVETDGIGRLMVLLTDYHTFCTFAHQWDIINRPSSDTLDGKLEDSYWI